MRNIYFASDHHLFHKKLINKSEEGFMHRPFETIEEHNETIIDNHNSLVKDNDIVWFLGDVWLAPGDDPSFKFDYTILDRFKGKKRLILGNHDTNAKRLGFEDHFDKILAYEELFKERVIVSHIPIHSSQLEERFDKNIHGHVHSKTLDDARYVNVSLENTDYFPVSLDRIMAENV